ncbi:MAG: hypothetical protein K2M29_02065, partial [Paramuribaculum sp.]|nr:hypothetical protein [Paramuribaculum sp.]
MLYSSLPVEDVSRIDYYSPDTRGAFGIPDIHSGGVIMVRLKQPGQRMKRYDDRYMEYIPLGYQRGKKFYTPKYELMADYELNNRPTLYWIPSAKV